MTRCKSSGAEHGEDGLERCQMNVLILVAPGNERDTEQFPEQICGPAITCQGGRHPVPPAKQGQNRARGSGIRFGPDPHCIAPRADPYVFATPPTSSYLPSAQPSLAACSSWILLIVLRSQAARASSSSSCVPQLA